MYRKLSAEDLHIFMLLNYLSTYLFIHLYMLHIEAEVHSGLDTLKCW